MVGNIRRGALYSPTVLDHVAPEMTVVRQETFGPVSPVIRFKSVEEAIRIANGTAYGLSSSLCTNRLDMVTRFVREQRWQDTPIPKPLPFPPNSPRGISVQIDPLLFA